MRIIATDLAFASDACAAVAMRAHGGRIVVDEAREWLPTRTEPLVPSVVCQAIVSMALAYEADAVTGDIHGREILLEHSTPAGLGWRLVGHTAEGKADAYRFARVLLRERKVVLRVPRDSRLVVQLQRTQVKAEASGALRVIPDESGGRHGDLVSAFTSGALVLRSALRDNSRVVSGASMRRARSTLV